MFWRMMRPFCILAVVVILHIKIHRPEHRKRNPFVLCVSLKCNIKTSYKLGKNIYYNSDEELYVQDWKRASSNQWERQSEREIDNATAEWPHTFKEMQIQTVRHQQKPNLTSNFSKVNLNKTELFWEEFSVDFKDSTEGSEIKLPTFIE